MSLYLLDTDHVTLFQHNHPNITRRISIVGDSNIAVTSITLEEQLRGRLATIRQSTTQPEKLAIAHANLHRTL